MLSQSETSRMKPYVRADKSFFADAFERLKERRQTLRLEPDPGCFSTRRVSGTIQYFRDDFGGVTSLRFSEGGDRIAVGFNSGELQVCKPALRDRRAGGESLLAGWEGNHSISCVKFHPKRPELLYASSTAGTVLRKDITGNEKYEDFFIIEKNNEIYSFDFGADGAKLITGGRDASIRIYDNVTQKIWDTRVPGGCVRDIDGPYIFGEAIDICQGKLLTASCQASNTLALWDIGSGKLITNIVPSNKSVYLYGEYPYTAQFYRGDPTGDMILCGGSGLGGLQVISIRRETIIYILEDEKPVVTVDSTDTNIAFGGKSNTVFFGNLYAQDESSQYVIRASSRETTMSSLMEMEMDME
ncbi:uncharacterized protein LOC124367160 isoform X2 [Homalodisca vitripennis]|uniref:uncharacterized protein LOC124367160 isoform X2 n=1 Tax=Homalodisca vitripennis TaxID=197043 RepID=UPI001EEA8845|nr:uncharacterized protein LOC124367160 isoform X2 [Homalodisca vitripennis]